MAAPVANQPGHLPPTPVAIDDGWVEWLADNLLQGCAEGTVLATMVAAGIPALAARQAIHRLHADPCFRAADKQRQQLRKLQSVVRVVDSLNAQQTGADQIERRAGLSSAEFIDRYYFGNRPLVLTDLARHWPAMTRWTPEYFARHYGDAMIEVQAGRNSDPDYEINSPRLKTQVRLRDFVQTVQSGQAGNDVYLTANNHALQRPDLAPLLADIGPLADWMDRRHLAEEALLWFGGPGVITPLHHDTLQLLHTQISGHKRWLLISPLQTPLVHNHIGVFGKLRLEQPEVRRQAEAEGLRVHELVVGPGETLFVPVGWWHHVQTLDTCISLSYTNFALPNRYEYANPQIRGW